MIMHCIQYAVVGNGLNDPVYIFNTENMTDAEVRTAAFSNEKIERYNRCPVCEIWTTNKGKLRDNIDCPAVLGARS